MSTISLTKRLFNNLSYIFDKNSVFKSSKLRAGNVRIPRKSIQKEKRVFTCAIPAILFREIENTWEDISNNICDIPEFINKNYFIEYVIRYGLHNARLLMENPL